MHAHIIDAVYQKMPTFFGREREKINVIKNLGSIYSEIEKQYQIPLGDFPELEKMQVSTAGTEICYFTFVVQLLAILAIFW